MDLISPPVCGEGCPAVYDGLYDSCQSKAIYYYSGDVYCWYGLTKGWVCGVVAEDSDWLGSYTGPHTEGSVDGNVHPVVQQG